MQQSADLLHRRASTTEAVSAPVLEARTAGHVGRIAGDIGVDRASVDPHVELELVAVELDLRALYVVVADLDVGDRRPAVYAGDGDGAITPLRHLQRVGASVLAAVFSHCRLLLRRERGLLHAALGTTGGGRIAGSENGGRQGYSDKLVVTKEQGPH